MMVLPGIHAEKGHQASQHADGQVRAILHLLCKHSACFSHFLNYMVLCFQHFGRFHVVLRSPSNDYFCMKTCDEQWVERTAGRQVCTTVGPCRVVRLRRAQLVPNYASGPVPGELIMSGRRHSSGFLSSRRPRKTGCRSFLSSVHSSKATWATSFGAI